MKESILSKAATSSASLFNNNFAQNLEQILHRTYILGSVHILRNQVGGRGGY